MAMPTPSRRDPPRALVVVLGDLGRSPRMLAHARALLARGYRVRLCGHAAAALPADLRATPALAVHDLGVRPLVAALRLLRLARDADWELAMVQNPPGFPALLALWLARGTRPARLVLDWHNLGAGLLAGPAPLRVLYAVAESAAAAFCADTHLAVTRLLARHLRDAFLPRHADLRLLRDAPVFSPVPPGEKAGRAAWWAAHADDANPTPPDEGALWVVCPSGWGPDEAMTLLFELADRWPVSARRRLALIATGLGRAREAFARELAARGGFARAELRLAWFSPEAYPGLLTRADAGLCLHTSSSGLDYPMKLVDFAAAGLPALAHDYGPALRECFPAGPGDSCFAGVESLTALLLERAETPPPRRRPSGKSWLQAWAEVSPDAGETGGTTV